MLLQKGARFFCIAKFAHPSAQRLIQDHAPMCNVGRRRYGQRRNANEKTQPSQQLATCASAACRKSLALLAMRSKTLVLSRFSSSRTGSCFLAQSRLISVAGADKDVDRRRNATRQGTAG